MSQRSYVGLIALFIVASPVIVHGAVKNMLYAVGPFVNGMQLHQIDPATAQITPIGLTGVETLIGLSFDSTGRLLSIDADAPGGRRVLELDLASGAATTRVNLGYSQMLREGDLAIDHGTGMAYVTDMNRLLQFNLASGALAAIAPVRYQDGDLAENANIDGLAFRSETLYGLLTIQAGDLNGSLITLDPSTRQISVVGNTGLSFNTTAGLAYDPADDVFYVAGTVDQMLYRVDPTTASATAVGQLDLPQVSGLAFASIPEPGCLALLGLGGLLLCRCRAM